MTSSGVIFATVIIVSAIVAAADVKAFFAKGDTSGTELEHFEQPL